MPCVQTNYLALEICNKIFMNVLWYHLFITTLFGNKIPANGTTNFIIRTNCSLCAYLTPTCLVGCFDL